MSNNGTNVVSQNAPANISVSTLKKAAFMAEVIRVQGLDLEDVMNGNVAAPDTFTRSQMFQIALEAGDPWFINYYGKQKTDRGLRELAAATGQSVEHYQNLMDNPPAKSRFGIRLNKPTAYTCKSVQNGQVFDPKAFVAPDGEIHYRCDWLMDALTETDRRLGREVFLARAERIDFVDKNVKVSANPTTDSEDQSDE